MTRGPSPMEGGSGEVFGTERASAGVVVPVRVRAAPVSGARRRGEPTLEETQRWFLEVVTHPGDVEAGVRAGRRRWGGDAGAWVTPGPVLDPVGRLEIYHHAYRARLRECLADDFPGVAAFLGPGPFTRLCDAVITRSPSRGPNLNHYGRVLVDHLRGTAGRVRRRAFLADLATLEWALVEAVHAAPPTTIDLDTLRAVPPDVWASARFTPSPALRVLAFEHPVNAWLQAFREGGSPGAPRRRSTATAVYRRGFVVWRMDLTPAMKELLDRLLAGVGLGDALAPLEGSAEAARVMEWFTAWVSGGFFGAVTFPEGGA